MPVDCDRGLARALAAIIVLGTVPFLVLGAVLNGFPLIFPDTASYIADGARLTTDLPRALGYAVFLKPFAWLGSLWAVVIVQAVLTLYVVRAMAEAFGCDLDAVAAFALVAGLAAFSTLSWTVSWVMPDIFAGLVVAGVSALVAGALAKPVKRAGLLIILTGLGAAMHSTTILLTLSLVLVGLAVACWQALTAPARRIVARVLALRMASVGALAIGSSLAMNMLAHGTPSLLPPYGTGFILARLAADGLLQDHLERHCASMRYRLCEHRHELPAKSDTFLWEESAPFTRLGSFRAMEEEARRLVTAIVLERPGAVLKNALRSTVEQVGRFDPGEDMKYARANPYVLPMLESFGIRGLDAYGAALQHDSQFPAAPVHALHVVGLLASVAALAVLLLAGGRLLTPAQRIGLVVVLIGVAVNAAICGGISAPTGRYNARVIWLLPYCAVVLSIGAVRRAHACAD